MVSNTDAPDIDFDERIKYLDGLETKMYGILSAKPKYGVKAKIFSEVNKIDRQIRDIENSLIEKNKCHGIKLKKGNDNRIASVYTRIQSRRQIRNGKVRNLRTKYSNYCRDNKAEMKAEALQAEKEKIIEYKKQFKEEWKHFKKFDDFKEKINALLHIEPQNERLEYIKWCIGVLREDIQFLMEDRKELDLRLKNAYGELKDAKIKLNDNEISEDEYLLKKEAHKAIKDKEKELKQQIVRNKNGLKYYKLEIKNGDFKQRLNTMAAQEAVEVLA
ncbi:hypothetical protein [uncultured Methanolobus sp.]|uniref:hypothetical protein n=1 Tax=uncultured Methanolobus sp. TaxID=218300 RepID=UPI0029C8A39C|nr:hypothetical protein [uncultured Methanolobus sp.]